MSANECILAWIEDSSLNRRLAELTFGLWSNWNHETYCRDCRFDMLEARPTAKDQALLFLKEALPRTKAERSSSLHFTALHCWRGQAVLLCQSLLKSYDLCIWGYLLAGSDSAAEEHSHKDSQSTVIKAKSIRTFANEVQLQLLHCSVMFCSYACHTWVQIESETVGFGSHLQGQGLTSEGTNEKPHGPPDGEGFLPLMTPPNWNLWILTGSFHWP